LVVDGMKQVRNLKYMVTYFNRVQDDCTGCGYGNRLLAKTCRASLVVQGAYVSVYACGAKLPVP